MQQKLFKENRDKLKAPNVASVPQYSPFRYPGGKSRHHPFVKDWISSFEIPAEIFIEPFAGGAHMGLAAGIERWVQHVILVEIDPDVAAVWKIILNGDVKWLINQIAYFKMTSKNVKELFDRRHESLRLQGLAMIVHNRISRGGITAPGAGCLKYGENGQGINSRWYPNTLITRIERIAKARERFTFKEGNGFEYIKAYADDPRVAFFIDPPYPKAGRRLYTCSDVDHDKVFELASLVKGEILLTYDNSEEIQELVNKYGLQSKKILMSTTHHRKKHELIIGRNLSWIS